LSPNPHQRASWSCAHIIPTAANDERPRKGSELQDIRLAALILPLSRIQLPCLGQDSGCAMAKPFTVCALCIISTAVGAGIEVAIEQGAPHLQQVVTPKAAVAAPTDVNVEVLGDRVKCDVRYQELKIPPDDYQSFKRKCRAKNTRTTTKVILVLSGGT
jgi:hypothetical protein